MSQLIALIIAIALGAIVTAIGYVYLGDAFTNNSAKGKAQQIINQGSQLELMWMGYKAQEGKIPYDIGTGRSSIMPNLIDKGFLKEELISPFGANYTLRGDIFNAGDPANFYITVYDIGGNSVDLELCKEYNKLYVGDETIHNFGASAGGASVWSVHDTEQSGCYHDSSSNDYVIVYEIAKVN